MATKETGTDFLTNQQRVGFIFVTLPFLNIVIIGLTVYMSTQPWLSLGIGLLSPVFGGGLISLGKKIRKERTFVIVTLIVNGLVACTFCAVSGHEAPSFIIGLTYITACTVLLNRIGEVLLFIAVGFLEILLGSALSGKGVLELTIAFAILICYTLVLVRFLQFTLKQGDSIVLAMEEIKKQKELIEEKNKSITDSINYALRIQQAKLPEKQTIYNALPESFVMFKPKDIVSGDFYFFYQKQNDMYIAAADCTGHGVPGALMSMIGMEKLEDTLVQETDTSSILQQLNRKVKASLKQTDSDESTRDGMDIALCRIHADKRSISYAGANRPVWIIRKNSSAIEETKATKKAIGGLTGDDEQFTTHELKIQEGDTFYIFSDGFADTFGGKTNKKLTTKKFKELLLSIQHLDMKQQEHYLDQFIETWKGDTEQVDDILVIGVRL
ncbi:MAG: SpoIIE family protein phosphatase [Bacteroidota bacterium]